MARDEFRKPDIETLQRRVANRCSNPDCRRPTVGPGANALAVINVGIAAHIHAASPGGPRYLSEMTSVERRGIANALWLCSNCSALIDRDTTRYSAEVLREWKLRAEEAARKEQGQRLPEFSDAVDQLTTAFTGNGSRFIPGAIANVHMATAASLSKLDPRFRVESEFRAGKSHFMIHALEPVPFSVHVEGDSASAWLQGMNQVRQKGRPAVLPMQGVTFVGSKLLAVMQDHGRTGTLTVSPMGRNSTLKVLSPDESGVPIAEDMQGTISFGSNAMHFEGTGCGGVVKVVIGIERNASGGIQGSLQMLVDFSVWEGIDVRQPPYLDKVIQLLKCLVYEPTMLQMHLEVEGEHVLTGRNASMIDPDLFRDALNFAVYTRHARTVARNINRAVPMRVNLPFSAEDHMQLADAADTFDGKKKHNRSHFPTTPSFTLLPTNGGQEMNSIVQANQFQELQLRLPEQKIVIFGLPVDLPPMEIFMHCVRLLLSPGKKVANGTEFDINTELGPDFFCEYRFVSKTET